MEKKSLVSYIYIGSPVKRLQSSYGTKPRIQLNDAFAEDLMNKDVLDAISQLEFLVVGTSKKNSLSDLADVVIPISNFTEREGTMTNLERRVQLSPKAHNSKKDYKSVWEFYSNLAQTIGFDDFNYESAEAVFDEIKEIIKEYEKIDYKTLNDGGEKWELLNKKVSLLPVKFLSKDQLIMIEMVYCFYMEEY